MSPEAYAKALARLDAGTLPERSVATLGRAAAHRLAQAQMRPGLADVIPMFWHDRTQRRQAEAEAAAIAKAAAHLLDVLEHSPQWGPYLQLPDAAIWGAAAAPIVPNSAPTLRLAHYLTALESYLLSADAPGVIPMWGRRSVEDRRKSHLLQFAIRYIAGAMPAKSDRPGATPGQRRYGRNAAIAHACSVILAQPIDRQTVAQTLKKTM
jgi:hypothetical protein